MAAFHTTAYHNGWILFRKGMRYSPHTVANWALSKPNLCSWSCRKLLSKWPEPDIWSNWELWTNVCRSLLQEDICLCFLWHVVILKWLLFTDIAEDGGAQHAAVQGAGDCGDPGKHGQHGPQLHVIGGSWLGYWSYLGMVYMITHSMVNKHLVICCNFSFLKLIALRKILFFRQSGQWAVWLWGKCPPDGRWISSR